MFRSGLALCRTLPETEPGDTRSFDHRVIGVVDKRLNNRTASHPGHYSCPRMHGTRYFLADGKTEKSQLPAYEILCELDEWRQTQKIQPNR
jgi:hypothetical protein